MPETPQQPMGSAFDGGHPDSEQLANLALEAPTAAGVKEHVASCPECRKDLSLLKSLLHADGPDGTGHEAIPQTEPVKETPGMADTADGTAEEPEPTPTRKEQQERAAKTLGSDPVASGMRKQTLALILIVLAAMLIIGLLSLR